MFRSEKEAVVLSLAIPIMDIHEIRQLIRQGVYEFSMHAQQERLAEDLDVTEIEEAITRGRSWRYTLMTHVARAVSF